MEFVNIKAWPRTDTGKGPNARLRRAGRIPAVSYGNGVASRSLSVSPKDLLDAMRGPFGRNAVLQVQVQDEAPFPALVCDHAVHPVTRDLLHVDLLRINLDVEVEVEIPLVCTGKAAGVVTGGVLNQIFRRLPVRCVPADIPQQIEFDVTPLDQGDTAKVSDLQLPKGVVVRLPAEQTVIAVSAPEAEPEPEAAEPGAEGAPAPEGGEPAAAPETKSST